MPVSLGTTTITALFLGTTSISSAYLGNTQVFGGSFTPLSLFSGGAQGIWLDPSDLSTMFSDRAGTTPVTAPGQLVGLRLDKSKGLALGAELVTNGDFATDSWWLKGGGCTISGGVGVATAAVTGSGFYRTAFLTVGSYYEITFTVVSISAGGFRIKFFGTNQSQTVTVPGTYTVRLVADTTGFVVETVGTTTGTVDNVSVKLITGNHAVAPTDAARPIYGVEPKGGRRNLLTWSEDFGNAVWVKQQANVSANAGVAPDGTTTADRITSTGGTGIRITGQTFTLSAVSHTISVWVKAAAAGNRKFRLVANQAVASAVGTASAVFDATDEWQRFSFTATGGSGYWGITQATSPDFDHDLLVWGAQLELGSTATAYQRVTTAYDVTESGVAICHYVQYDGSDDSMSTAAIDFTATDKMSVFAGVRKNSDALTGMLVELSANAGSFGGAFYLVAPSLPTNAYEVASRGFGGVANVGVALASFPAPSQNILTMQGDISGDTLRLRVNGAQVAQSTADQGTGNFSTYPLYIGRRNNASLSFNGRDYGLIVVGKAASAGEITDTETWLAARTSGVTL